MLYYTVCSFTLGKSFPHFSPLYAHFTKKSHANKKWSFIKANLFCTNDHHCKLTCRLAFYAPTYIYYIHATYYYTILCSYYTMRRYIMRVFRKKCSSKAPSYWCDALDLSKLVYNPGCLLCRKNRYASHFTSSESVVAIGGFSEN